MNTHFYIFRHGDTFVTKSGTRLGAFSYGLQLFSASILPDAMGSLKQMGEYLKKEPLDFCVSSPIVRCRQTAEIITSITKKPFFYDNRLREFFLESYGSLRRRLTELLLEIEEKHYTHVAVCTHAAVIAALISLITARKDRSIEFSLFKYPPPGVLTIISENHLKEISFNEVI